MKIGVILGSIRKGRAGESVAKWVMDNAAGREGYEYELLDLADFRVPLLEAEMIPGAANKQYADGPPPRGRPQWTPATVSSSSPPSTTTPCRVR